MIGEASYIYIGANGTTFIYKGGSHTEPISGPAVEVQYFVQFDLDSGSWFKDAFPFFWSYGWIDV